MIRLDLTRNTVMKFYDITTRITNNYNAHIAQYLMK